MKHTLTTNILSVLSTVFVYLVGGFDVAIQSLLIVMIIDYISGVASAIYNKKLSSKVGVKGILKKIVYLLVVTLSVVMDNLTGQSGVLRTIIIYFFVANDGISIIENMAEMNIKLPQKLIDTLEQLKNRSDN